MRGQPGQPIALDTRTVPVFRLLGHNPGPMTGPGTNSYLLGAGVRCLIDPGPADEQQLQCFLKALGEQGLDYILVTHTHRDHSPGAQRLQELTGAVTIGLPVPDAAGQDKSFKPDMDLGNGDVLDCGDYSIELIHTPGHVSNHLCFLLREEGLLFTGDHVLQGTTPVILPPDGNMGAYLKSLTELLDRDIAALAPGHGELMTEPQKEIRALISHRLKREEKVIAGLQVLGECDLDNLVVQVYDDVAAHLLPWAKKTLLAHLLKLDDEGKAAVRRDGDGEYWRLLQ